MIGDLWCNIYGDNYHDMNTNNNDNTNNDAKTILSSNVI